LTETAFPDSDLSGTSFLDCRLGQCDFSRSVNLHSARFPVPVLRDLPKKQKEEPSTPEEPDYLDLFDSGPDMNLESLGKRFREMTRKYHPDLFVGVEPEERHKAVERFRKIREAYLYLCHQLNQQKTTPREVVLTIENLMVLLEMDPTNPVIYFNLGVLYFRDRQYDSSIRCYEQALLLDPDNYMFKYNLGVTRIVKTIYESESRKK